LLVDGGDVGASPKPSSAFRTPILWDAMIDMGYDLISIGALDIADTTRQWLARWKGPETRFLFGNATGEGFDLPSWAVFERNGLKIGFVSAIPNQSTHRFPGYKISEMENHLQKAKTAFLEAAVDFKVILFYGMPSEGLKIAKSRSDYDLILIGRSNARPMSENLDAGHIPMVGPGDRGRELALITLEKADGAAKVSNSIIPLDGKNVDPARAIKWNDIARQTAKEFFSRPRAAGNSSGQH